MIQLKFNVLRIKIIYKLENMKKLPVLFFQQKFFNKILAIGLVATTVLFNTTVCAQDLHSDNGDGKFTNPVIPGDFPDPDVIRVDDTYYMVSTTMFVFPGVTLLKSKDLVNWEYCSNAVERFDFNPCYDLEDFNRYGHGQWATSLKYYNGKFRLLFITLDEGGFTCTATNPEGPWEVTKLKTGYYDPGLFYDDDGKIYVAEGYGEIFITEVDENLDPIGEKTSVYKGDIRGGLEGSHVYKRNGYYYLYSTYGGANGIQVALRSKNIYGPYEQKVVLDETRPGIHFGMHQGALIETQTGEWWTMLFVDRGPLGRIPSLQPVTWVDDWPMVGVNGKAVTTLPKPDVGKEYPIKVLPTSDEFDAQELGMQWGWNHNPDSTKWSLSERKGYLRLETASVVDSFPKALNTLTQRSLIKYDLDETTVATTKLKLNKMKDGDLAGLAVFQDPYSYLGVQKEGKSYFLVRVLDGMLLEKKELNKKTVYLQTSVLNKTGLASFRYSLDGKNYTKMGEDFRMRFRLSVFTGNKICLFNYATEELGGYVDFDFLRME